MATQPRSEYLDKPVTLDSANRIYYYPTQYGLVEVPVNNVIELIVRESGTHRLKTADGSLVCMPAGWLKMVDKSKDWKI